MKAHNLVIPSNEIKNNQYCEFLTKKYEVSNPKYLEVQSLISQNDNNINAIREFLYKITYLYEREIPFKEFRDMISICRSFLKICDNLKSENYNDGETFYRAIDSLNFYCYLLIGSKDMLITNAMNDKTIFLNHEKKELEFRLEALFLEFEHKVKLKIFDFWNYDFRLMASFEPIDSDFSSINH